jgi:tetratricopeptide (TPR) repeat protein
VPQRDPDVAYWERKVAADRDTDDALYLAQLYRERGLLEESCKLCWDILEDDPEHPPAMAELAETLFMMGDRLGALKCYEDAKAFGVAFSLEMAFRRALCLYAAGRIEEAEKALLELLEEDPFVDGPFDALAGIYEETGRKRQVNALMRRRNKMRAVQEREGRTIEEFIRVLTGGHRKLGRR